MSVEKEINTFGSGIMMTNHTSNIWSHLSRVFEGFSGLWLLYGCMYMTCISHANLRKYSTYLDMFYLSRLLLYISQ